MRLGVIEFGTPCAETPPLLAVLRVRSVDVITRLEAPPASSPRDEAERLHRAECDGVLLTIGDGVVPDDVAEAMLFIHCPILIATVSEGSESGQRLIAEATAVVMALAVAADAREVDVLPVDFLESWLRENVRSSRQKGIEAAHKLYGTRLLIHGDSEIASPPSKLCWLRQFGVLVRDESGSGNPRADDIFVSGGNALGGLTQRLLCLISGLPEAITIARSQLLPDPLLKDHVVHTIVLLAAQASERESEHALKVYGQVLRGTETGDGIYSIGQPTLAFLAGEGPSEGNVLYAVPGDFVGAVRAALNTLDVPTVVLRDV